MSAPIRTHERREAALATITLLFIASSQLAAAKQPPSSLQRPGALIRFIHTHQRVTSCHLQTNALTCTARHAPAASGIAFTLTPEPGQLVSRPAARRDPIAVSLPDREGATSLELRVQSGNWSLSWADQHVAFHVEKQRNFTLQLLTTSGACTFEEGQCRRRDDALSRNVVIPPDALGAL